MYFGLDINWQLHILPINSDIIPFLGNKFSVLFLKILIKVQSVNQGGEKLKQFFLLFDILNNLVI